MGMPPWFEEVDHTGDTGIRVTAPDLKMLFERTAWAMFTILTDLGEVSEETSRSLTLDAADLDDLLVRWLSDLNFLHLTERLLFRRFNVLDVGGRQLRAEAWGETAQAGRHTVHTEIKAVTYHALEVRESNEGWTAQVIFDM